MANNPIRICSVTGSGRIFWNKAVKKLPKVKFCGTKEKIFHLEDGKKPIKHDLKLQREIEQRNTVKKQAILKRGLLSKSKLHTIRVCRRVVPLLLVKLNTYDTDNRISERSKESSASL